MDLDVSYIVYDRTRGVRFFCVDKIVEEIELRKRNPNFLSEILPFLASVRRDLARETNPCENALFGALRDAPPYNRNFRTCFASENYGPYNKRWLDFVYTSLSRLVLNPLSSIEGLVQQMDSGRSYLIDTYESDRRWRLSFTVYELHQLPSNLAKLHLINDSLFPLRYLFLYAENFLEIDDCFVPLSQYLVRFDYYMKPDSLSSSLLNEVNIQGLEGRIINILPLVVIHQNYDPNHVLFTEMDKIVHRILNTAEPQLIDPLIDLIGQFRYIFAHVCPYCKGNEDIAEWIETAMYRYLGFVRTSSEHNSSIDLEALSSLSLEDFLSKYRTLLHLEIDPDKWAL